MGECSVRYWLAGETARYLSVEITAIELADEIDTSGDVFQAGIDFESEKASVLYSDRMMSEYLDTDAAVPENLNLQELLRLNVMNISLLMTKPLHLTSLTGKSVPLNDQSGLASQCSSHHKSATTSEAHKVRIERQGL